MSKTLLGYRVTVDGDVIKTIKLDAEIADELLREKKARQAAQVQMQRWFYSDQFPGRKLAVEARYA